MEVHFINFSDFRTLTLVNVKFLYGYILFFILFQATVFQRQKANNKETNYILNFSQITKRRHAKVKLKENYYQNLNEKSENDI